MLQNLRKNLDNIDKNIILLLEKRYKITKKIGKIKKLEKKKIVDPAREKEIIIKIKDLCDKHDLPKKEIIAIFKQILKLSYHSQK